MSMDTTENKEEKKEEKEVVVEVREISFDGIMKSKDVELVTGLSGATLWRLEKAGKFPARVQLSENRVGRHGHEVKAWIKTRPRVALAQ